MTIMPLSLLRQEEMCVLAMEAMDHYCSGDRASAAIDLGMVRDFVVKRAASGAIDDWRDVLDAALSDAGYAVYWRGNEVFEVVGWA